MASTYSYMGTSRNRYKSSITDKSPPIPSILKGDLPKVTTRKFSYLENYLENLKKKKEQAAVASGKTADASVSSIRPGSVSTLRAAAETEQKSVAEPEKKSAPEGEKKKYTGALSTDSILSGSSDVSGYSGYSGYSVGSGVSGISTTSSRRESTYKYINSYRRGTYGSTTSLPAITISQPPPPPPATSGLKRQDSLRSTESLPLPKPLSRQGSQSSVNSCSTPVQTRRSFFRQARESIQYGLKHPSMLELYKMKQKNKRVKHRPVRSFSNQSQISNMSDMSDVSEVSDVSSLNVFWEDDDQTIRRLREEPVRRMEESPVRRTIVEEVSV